MLIARVPPSSDGTVTTSWLRWQFSARGAYTMTGGGTITFTTGSASA